MENQTELYVLYSCDEWKNHKTMCLRGVFTRSGLINAIKTLVMKKEMEIEFKHLSNLDTMEIQDMDTYLRLNTYLTYGYIESVTVDELN